MKKLSILLVVVLLIFVSLGWYSFFQTRIDDLTQYNRCIQNAETSVEKQLYQQALTYYRDSMRYKTTQKTYDKIEEVYELYYAEEHNDGVRTSYLQAMRAACEAYPNNAAYWLKAVELCKEANDNNSAYALLKRAKNNNIKDAAIDEYYYELKYMVGNYDVSFSSFYSSLNGYITISDGESWKVVDEQGEKVTEAFKKISPISDDGVGLYAHSIDTRLIDSQGITRARYDFDFDEAGVFDTQTMMMPVKIGEKWKYVNLNGEFLPNEYDAAGTMCNGKAAVCNDGKWTVINAKGETVSGSEYADIKLGLGGKYIQGNIVFAKENEKYAIYDENMKMLCDPLFDDVDVSLGNMPIAFKSGDKWGFMDNKGKVIKEPEFAEAKSFSNGYAAIKNEDGKWGFINEQFSLVIDFQYNDAYYFNSNGNAIVSTDKGSYGLIRFIYE